MSNGLEPPRRSYREQEQAQPKREKQAAASVSANFTKSPFFAKGAIDIPFFAIVISLLTTGLIMLLSASYPYALQKYDNSYHFFTRQLIFAVLGVVGMILISRINFRVLKAFTIPIVALSLFLLVLVLFYHVNLDREEDFKRWIPIGPLTFQPSDLAKFTLVLLLAWYMTNKRRRMHKMVEGFIFPMAMVAVYCGLIALEHHLSCTIMMLLLGVAMIFVGGAKWQFFAGGAGLVFATAGFVITKPDVLPSYAAERIIAWLDKTYEPLGARWQTNNALYAIGSGGIFGVGLGNSKQKYLYVSEPQNDFIFSIVCEELGFIGATAIIILFALLFYRGIKIAMNCEDRFGSLLVIGIVCQVAIQTIFNILVVTDSFPNTGISLPFFSYGGTALLILCLEMGVVLSVSRRANNMKV